MDSLTKNDLVDVIVEEMDALGHEVDAMMVKAFLASLEEAVMVEVMEGRKVTVPGIVRLTPGFVEAKPRRKMANPFDPESEERWVKAKPASTKLRATPARGMKLALPTAKSAAGQQLAKAAAKSKRNGTRSR